jgi:parallel beta-helix repeat protein
VKGRSLFVVALVAAAGGVAFGEPAAPGGNGDEPGRTFFVRQAAGDDHNDGTSPEKAWRRISRLSGALEAGDTAYVGPGLYRDQIVVRGSGAPDRRIRILADPKGEHTRDRPGVVMITGAEPVDEKLFEPAARPGVYQVRFSAFVPVGVVEMDGPQLRYMRARSTREHLVDGLTELEVVAIRPSTYFHDAESGILYLHTSDGAAPARHELELMRRGAGITVANRHFVTVSGFTIRHTGDAGLLFSDGARHGIAIDNVCWGHRIGIRVNGASDVLVSGNVLFRNENSGVYFLRGASEGKVIDNVLYENVKGARFGSRSNHGLVIGNAAFRNREVGVSVEDSRGAQVMDNRMARNGDAQLLFLKGGDHQSEGNCFEAVSPEQAVAGLEQERLAELARFQQATGQDRGSRDGDCGPLPAPLDVHGLHAESQGYATQGPEEHQPQR